MDDRVTRTPVEQDRGPESQGRLIAHLDLDAFFVSVELQRRPELKGLPVVVAGEGPRDVVTTASYEARRKGVGSAMPSAKARRLCPEAIFIPPDGSAYRRASEQVMGIVHHHIEIVEEAGLDEAYMDLTGMTAPVAAMKRVTVDIERETGLHASVGIGPNRLIAKIASDADKPRGFLALTRDQAMLRFADDACSLIPGIGPKTSTRLARMGIRTIRDLASAGADVLREEFGPRQGVWLLERANFRDDTPVQPRREAVSESREQTFDSDISDPGELVHRLDLLCGELAAALRNHDHAGRTVGIKVRYADFETHTHATTLQDPIRDADSLSRTARRLLEEFRPSRPVRLLGVRVAGFGSGAGREGQLSLPVG